MIHVVRSKDQVIELWESIPDTPFLKFKGTVATDQNGTAFKSLVPFDKNDNPISFAASLQVNGATFLGYAQTEEAAIGLACLFML